MCFDERMLSVVGQGWKWEYLHFSQCGKRKSWTEDHQESTKKECWEESTLLEVNKWFL